MPFVVPSTLCSIVHDILGEVLDIARIVVDPRQGDSPRPRRVARIPSLCRSGFARRPGTEVEFIYINIVERPGEVLLAAPFEKLTFDLGGVYLVDSDRAELEKLAVAYLALVDNLSGNDIGTVDVAENGDVLRAVFQWKSDAQSIAVRTAE